MLKWPEEVREALSNLTHYAKVLETIAWLKFNEGIDVSSVEKSFNKKYDME